MPRNPSLPDQSARLHEAARTLADEAAHAVCEPRRFLENEGDHQQRLGHAVARVRLLLNGAAPDEEQR
jgi:hypothetical protein